MEGLFGIGGHIVGNGSRYCRAMTANCMQEVASLVDGLCFRGVKGSQKNDETLYFEWAFSKGCG